MASEEKEIRSSQILYICWWNSTSLSSYVLKHVRAAYGQALGMIRLLFPHLEVEQLPAWGGMSMAVGSDRKLGAGTAAHHHQATTHRPKVMSRRTTSNEQHDRPRPPCCFGSKHTKQTTQLRDHSMAGSQGCGLEEPSWGWWFA